MSEDRFRFDGFVEDEEGFPKIFEVSLFEEYGDGDYTLETIDEYGRHSIVLAISTHGAVKLPKQRAVQVSEPEHPFAQTFNSFRGADTIFRRNGKILPFIAWFRFEISVDDVVPEITVGVYREKSA